MYPPIPTFESGFRTILADPPWRFANRTGKVAPEHRKDGGPDGRGFGFYFRNVTELLLFGVKGRMRSSLRDGARSTSSKAVSANTPANPTNNTG